MANQKAILNLRPAKGGQPVGKRIVIVDSDGGVATWTGLGAAESYTTEMDYIVDSIQGQGSTAPATATAVQFNVNGEDRSKFLNVTAIFDAKASQQERLGAALGALIPQGTNLRLIGRA